jgi:hypothetical protein
MKNKMRVLTFTLKKKTFTEQEKEFMHERGVVQDMMNNKRQ